MKNMKKCKLCGREKKLESFNRNKATKDGYLNVCKICHNNRMKEWRKLHPNKPVNTDGPKMNGLTKHDWCKMYSFMIKLGYDPDQDLHKQFAERYNLQYKKRPYKNYLTYTFKDCSNTNE